MAKEFFRTEELHCLHPELMARDDVHDNKSCVVFSNSDSANLPEWPSTVDFWVDHEHERNVDDNIYDPLRLYPDRSGLSERLTGVVYSGMGTEREILSRHLSYGYAVEVMFGKCIKLSESHCSIYVMTPHDVELALSAGTQTLCVMIRSLHDKRQYAVGGITYEPYLYLHRHAQFSADKFRRYEFFVYPLLPANLQTGQLVSIKEYVHYFAAMYNSCIMLARRERMRQKS